MNAYRLTPLVLLLGGCLSQVTPLEIGKSEVESETGLQLDTGQTVPDSGQTPEDSGEVPEDSGEPPVPDEDGDGFNADDDCDDTNAAINPDATEVCDGVDNDCDGTVDQDAADASTWYADADGDSFGNAEDSLTACEAPSGYVIDNTDCNDAEALVFPGGEEACDGLDNDCSGETDEEACSDCTQVSYEAHTYQFCSGPSSWTDALGLCTAWGYSLATVEDADEDAMLSDTIESTGIGSAWIGLNDRGEGNEGTFTWASGLSSSYEGGWAPDEPNSYQGRDEDCVEKRDDFDWEWNDLTCEEAIAFICEGSF